MHRILVIDDNEPIRKMIKRIFEAEDFDFREADTLKKAHGLLDKEMFNLIITDLKLPDGEGSEVLERRNANRWNSEVIIITAYGDVETAVSAMKEGAFDFVIKPINIDEFEARVKKALERVSLKKENEVLKQTINYIVDSDHADLAFSDIIGRSSQMDEIIELVKRVSRSSASVLITGESGVGKELIARAIHFNSDRKDKPFIKVNCAVFSEGILESELFGHEKGAFTGALQKRLGRFEIADGGTIFLDEIGDLSPHLQIKLLQVLQEYNFERVGGNEVIKVDVRIIAATNQDLAEKIKQKTFREDLFYRINVVPLHIPPLRERKKDIEVLTEHFICKYASLASKGPMRIDGKVMEILKDYDWPGNVRELEHAIERMVILSRGETISEADIPREIFNPEPKKPQSDNIDGDLKSILENFEKETIRFYLVKFNFDKNIVAAKLGLKLSTLYNKIEKYGLK